MKFEKLAFSQMKEHESDGYGYAPAYDGEGIEELIYSFSAYKSYYVLEHGARRKDFDDYCKKLNACGFTLYSTKTSNGNRFATYTDGENIVNVCHISYKDTDNYIVRDVSYISIAVDHIKNSALPEKCGSYEKVTSVQLTTDGVGFIIRMVDGRFLVIDSHLRKPEKIEYIYNTLCEQNVLGGKPVVASWMITHAHPDHVGAFLGVLEKYGDSINIQSMIHGFPGEDSYVGKDYVEYEMDKTAQNMTARSNAVHDTMAEKMPNAKTVVAHTGQIFEYPEAKIEVVYTSENLYRQQMIDTNMSSVVYKIILPGGVLLAMGDAVDLASKTIRKIYGKELTCDAVILAHHALNGGDEELYCNMQAKVAIWPINYEQILSRTPSNTFILNHFRPEIVWHHLIVSNENPIMKLYEGISPDEIACFDRKIKNINVGIPDFDKRKKTDKLLSEDYHSLGFGNAPRYYGNGYDVAPRINEAEKTYSFRFENTTKFDFENYCNTLKRNGYLPTVTKDENEAFHAYAPSLLNAVYVDYLPDQAQMNVTVGRAGKDLYVIKNIVRQ